MTKKIARMINMNKTKGKTFFWEVASWVSRSGLRVNKVHKKRLKITKIRPNQKNNFKKMNIMIE
jgi:hypothetical protein